MRDPLTAVMDGKTLTIKKGEINISLGMAEIRNVIESMDKKSQIALGEAICFDNIFKQACQRLAGNEWDNWDGDDYKTRLEFLSQVEDTLLEGYKWSMLGDLVSMAKKNVWNRTLYDISVHETWFDGVIKQHNLDEKVDAEVAEFKEMVEAKFDEMIKLKKNT